ncbi:MAG TPA: DnaD domain protein [Clostridiales bacterium]|nr:DnaD domain protein [Clostridiales bacterium]
MDYTINPTAFVSAFTVPCSVVDKHIKLAGAAQLKVLLWIMRNMADGICIEKISQALGLPEIDVKDALQYWIEAGIINSAGEKPEKARSEETKPEKAITVRKAPVKPSREEVAKRGLECPEIAFLLQEAQLKFGRGLRQNEASTLVWLYDDEGLSAALILMIIEYAISENKCNIGFIERTAIDWINSGIDSISAAEKKIRELNEQKSAWNIVRSAMGIEDRRPSPNELKLAYKWVVEYGFSREILAEAYNQCVDNTSKFSMPYIKKILEDWHKKNVKTLEDIKSLKKPAKADKKNNYAAYDLDLAQKMLLMDEGEDT